MRKMSVTAVSVTTEAVLHSLLRAFGLVHQVMEPYFARFGITGPQWGILRILHRGELRGESELRLKDVAARLFIQPPSVTGAVDRLERQGLLKRTGTKTDLRVRRVSLTRKGRALVVRALVGHPKKIGSLFAGLKTDELKSLLQLLHKLEAHLSTLTPRRPDLTARNI